MVVKMTRRGSITLPKALRRNLETEAQFDIVCREDGVIELHPRARTDPSQAWFWTERWQKMEREVEQSYARGDCETFETGEDFMAYLKCLDAQIKAVGGHEIFRQP